MTALPGAGKNFVLTERVVQEARRWIGTPYRHQASLRGVGCDCLGLIRGIWRAQYGEEPEPMPGYTPDWDEPARQEVLLGAAGRHLLAVPGLAEARPGDVLVFRMRPRAVAKHLGILGPRQTFIHAMSGKGVVQSPLSTDWLARVAAVFRFP